jgi:hypothetical protein
MKRHADAHAGEHGDHHVHSGPHDRSHHERSECADRHPREIIAQYEDQHDVPPGSGLAMG